MAEMRLYHAIGDVGDVSESGVVSIVFDRREGREIFSFRARTPPRPGSRAIVFFAARGLREEHLVFVFEHISAYASPRILSFRVPARESALVS